MQYHVGGELVDAADATLSVDDRAVAFGDAVTDTLRCYGGLLRVGDTRRPSVRRLRGSGVRSRRRRRRPPGAGRGDPGGKRPRGGVGPSLDHPGARWGLFDPLPDAARHRPPTDPDPTVVVTATPVPDGRGPVRLQTVRTRALPTASVPAAPLTHARLDAVRAQAELRTAAPPDDDPADEALLLDADGHVVGGTASDPVFVDGEAIRLPALGDRPARTATRSVVRELADGEGFRSPTCPVRPPTSVPPKRRSSRNRAPVFAPSSVSTAWPSVAAP
ncbi:aminotransferase class IV [Haloplanus litoreus]|uniref:aminotransferase class IV n=1 Tax=Haloplanus litoreus TaxID=767515 RepID=UPI00361F3527